MQKEETCRLPSLDGWRAVAIVLVLLSHWWGTQGAENIPAWTAPIRSHGDLGVRIFLVISGLLITYLLLREDAERGSISLRAFYARRVLRIFPVYFAYLAVLGVLTALGIYHDNASTWLGSLTFTRNIVGDGNSATLHLWSLAVEEQFYLLWPLVLVAFRLPRRPRLAVGLLFAAAVLAVVARSTACGSATFFCARIIGQRSLPAYMDSLAIGCISAFILVHARHWLRAYFFWPSCTALAATAFLPVEPMLVLIQSALAAAAILSSIEARARLLNWSPIVLIGTLSYSLYIWHVLFASTMIHYSNWLNDWRFWFAPAFGVAAVSYFFFEKPLLSLRRHFR